MNRRTILKLAAAGLVLPATGCLGQSDPGTLTIYSGRTESLVDPVLQQFSKETGTNIRIRYGDTAELAATILEEGNNSPADVFFAQDAGALGAIAKAGKLRKLPGSILDRVDSRYRSPNDEWVGISGRARVLVYNTAQLQPAALPDTIQGLTEARWQGKLGWAPSNGSFQAFVTALRITEGEAGARTWLEAIKRNQPRAFPNNITILDAVGKGEVTVGLVNHYYLHQFLKEQGDKFGARNYHPRGGGPGAMVNVAGAGILNTSKNTAAGERFIAYLLGKEAQTFFSEDTSEYPLSAGVQPLAHLTAMKDINAPKIDLGNLDDLSGTLKLLRELAIL